MSNSTETMTFSKFMKKIRTENIEVVKSFPYSDDIVTSWIMIVLDYLNRQLNDHIARSRGQNTSHIYFMQGQIGYFEQAKNDLESGGLTDLKVLSSIYNMTSTLYDLPDNDYEEMVPSQRAIYGYISKEIERSLVVVGD